MTKRKLIEALEALECSDDTRVTIYLPNEDLGSLKSSITKAEIITSESKKKAKPLIVLTAWKD